MSDKEMHFQLTDAFLNRCADMIEFRRVSKAEKPKEWLEELERIGQDVRLLRLRLGENHQSFAKRIGVDPLDLFVVEQGAIHSPALKNILERIDDNQHSSLAKRFDVLLGIS